MSQVKQKLTIKEQLLQSISEGIDEQNAKGLKNYNQTLDECPIEDYEWNIMQIEELIDANQYAIKQIIKLEAELKCMREENLRLRQTMDKMYSTMGE